MYFKLICLYLGINICMSHTLNAQIIIKNGSSDSIVINKKDIKSIQIDSIAIHINLNQSTASKINRFIYGPNTEISIQKLYKNPDNLMVLPATIQFLPDVPVIHYSNSELRKLSYSNDIDIRIGHLKSKEAKESLKKMIDSLVQIVL